jgi:hypothetical protein
MSEMFTTTTSDGVHFVGFKMEIYDDEARALIKLLNRTLQNGNLMCEFSDNEVSSLNAFSGALKDNTLSSC